jgi:D-alanyl-D-alanine carboxypeptidase/D-alanyl-D-alanine-endopeptidase (penicillin-binding protein 4)
MASFARIAAAAVAIAWMAAAPAPAMRAAPADGLAARLGAIFDTGTVNALWAVKVVSLDTGAVLFERNPRLLVMPASTMKVVTLAVAADRLGWDARFTTRLETTGTVTDGVLTGDLIVTGGGDPTIGEREDAPRVLDDWACRLATLGIRRVEGRLVGDDDAFPDQALGTGWAWDDLPFGFAAPTGALQYHESAAQVVITAGPRPDTPASIRLEPAGTDLVVTGQVWTTAPDVPALVYTSRRLSSRTLEVSGTVPRSDRDYVRNVAVDNPTRAFLGAFRDALVRNGIAVTGESVDVDDLAAKPPAIRTVLLTHESPPLAEIAVRLMKTSQNLIAETLMTRIGLVSDTPDVDPMTAARGAYERTLAAWGVPADSIVVADGSGLSRYDLLTAEALVVVLTQMARDPRHAAPFEASLPIMGVDGTLERRQRNTVLEGRVRAKTGTISNVRALAGFLTTQGGERLAFAVVANNFKARGSVVDGVVDRALLEILASGTSAGCCLSR